MLKQILQKSVVNKSSMGPKMTQIEMNRKNESQRTTGITNKKQVKAGPLDLKVKISDPEKSISNGKLSTSDYSLVGEQFHPQHQAVHCLPLLLPPK